MLLQLEAQRICLVRDLKVYCGGVESCGESRSNEAATGDTQAIVEAYIESKAVARRIPLDSGSSAPSTVVFRKLPTVSRIHNLISVGPGTREIRELRVFSFSRVLKMKRGFMAETNFGWALWKLTSGKRVSRLGWNGKGMYIELQKPDANSKMTLPYIFMKTAQGDLVPWLASQTDILATDWDEVKN